MEKETQIKEYAECALTWLGEIQDNEKAVKHIDHFIRQVIAWADTTPIDDYIEMQNKISGMYSEKEVETRIAEAVKRERARILEVARNWTGCKYCSTGETLKELVHPAPSNEGDKL